jgi:hypothetical protein
MDSPLHWIGVAVVLLIIAFGLVGFWRGLSWAVVLPKGSGVGRLAMVLGATFSASIFRWLDVHL